MFNQMRGMARLIRNLAPVRGMAGCDRRSKNQTAVNQAPDFVKVADEVQILDLGVSHRQVAPLLATLGLLTLAKVHCPVLGREQVPSKLRAPPVRFSRVCERRYTDGLDAPVLKESRRPPGACAVLRPVAPLN